MHSCIKTNFDELFDPLQMLTAIFLNNKLILLFNKDSLNELKVTVMTYNVTKEIYSNKGGSFEHYNHQRH